MLVDWEKCVWKITTSPIVGVWNAGEDTSSFWNDCPVGISWITVRGVLTHYLSAFASMLCALLLPGEQIELWPPGYVIMIVFSFDEREQGEGNRVKLAGPTSLPEKGRHHVVSPVCTPPPAPHCSWSSLSYQRPQLAIIQLNINASNLLCSGAGRKRFKHKNIDLNKMKYLLCTHCRLDIFICNLYHISVSGGWPCVTDGKAEVSRSQEHGAS